jgi:hypothetical protein
MNKINPFKIQNPPQFKNIKSGDKGEEIKDKVILGSQETGVDYLSKMKLPSFQNISHSIISVNNQEPLEMSDLKNAVQKETSDSKPAETKEWNVLVYMAGDNNLEENMANNMMTLEKSGSDEKMNILVQFDRGMRQHKGVSQWDGAKRFYVTKSENENPQSISSQATMDVGDTDTSQPEHLTDFIVWAHQNYPAKHTIIIISNHGGGFAGLANDDTNKTVMSMPGLEKALDDAKKAIGKDKFDIVGFDCCLMGQSEVAYQLKDHAKIMIGSEEAESKEGWPYGGLIKGEDKIMNVMKSFIQNKGSEATPEEVASQIVEEASKNQKVLPTLSAIDLTKMDNIGKKSSEFADEVMKVMGAREAIRRIANKTESYSKVIPLIEPYGQYRDFVNFLENVIESNELDGPAYKNIKIKADELLKEVKGSIIAEEHDETRYGKSNGLSVYLPTSKPNPAKYGYDKTKWAQDTTWDEMLVEPNSVMGYTGKTMDDFMNIMMGTGKAKEEEWTFTPAPHYEPEKVMQNKVNYEKRLQEHPETPAMPLWMQKWFDMYW